MVNERQDVGNTDFSFPKKVPNGHPVQGSDIVITNSKVGNSKKVSDVGCFSL